MTSKSRTSAPSYPEGHALLSGKTVLVTAAAGAGVGFATARRCAEEGASVILSDIHPERLDRCADELSAQTGRGVHRVLCDVRSDEAVRDLIARVESEWGRIDVLVNNAGLGLTKDIVDLSNEEWLDVLDVNLNGTFRMLRAALPGMHAQGAGSVINVASITAWRAEAGQTAYAAAKAGLLALTRCAALESADFGVRVNAVVPSLAIHPHLERVASRDFLMRMIRENEAFGRAAEPWEVGNAVVFLASDYASYMTGEALSVSCRRA